MGIEAAGDFSILDDSLGIDWRIPTEHANLSEKDKIHEVLKDFESLFDARKSSHGSHGWNGRAKPAGSAAVIFTFPKMMERMKSTIPVWATLNHNSFVISIFIVCASNCELY